MKKLDNNIYVTDNRSTAVIFAKTSEKQITSSTIPLKIERGYADFAYWGDDNLYPQQFLKKYAQTDSAVSGLEVLCSAHYGSGFKLYQEQETEQGVVAIERSLHAFPEIKNFFKGVNWDKLLFSLIVDYEMWRLAFVECVLSPDKSKIVSVRRLPAAWCRFSVPNPTKKFSEYIVVNSDWEHRDPALDVQIPLLPDAFFGCESIKDYVKEKKWDRFVISISGVKIIEKFYPSVGWHSSFNNGWVDTVHSVPNFKKWMFENQLHFKYVVYISDEFMSRKYGANDWEDFTAEQKENKRNELAQLINEHMSGNQAAGRSLIAPFFKDANGNLIKGIEIEAIDDKIKDGNFLPDAAAGNSQILFAMGVDPSLIGAGIPGGKSLSGSGSDKREAYTILCTKMPVKRIYILELFNFLRDFNLWEETLCGKFPNLNLTTLDKNPNGVVEVIQ